MRKQITIDDRILEQATSFCEHNGYNFSGWVQKLIRAELVRRKDQMPSPAPEDVMEASFGKDSEGVSILPKRITTRADIDGVNRLINELRLLVDEWGSRDFETSGPAPHV
jgi:hypothetical protein